ncbi:MAG TPA: hypothetical protein PLJ74_13315 [Myxococcota bacterium]|nr:hypothetical protein [Myxococcota bacterium]
MTHLILGVYTAEGITAIWGNLEYDDHILDGVIYRVAGLAEVLRRDVKIIRPKQLSIYTNDKALAQEFTKPVKSQNFPILRGLAMCNKWKFYYVDGDKLTKAKKLWTDYKK